MCDTPIGTTKRSPAKKWNDSKKLTYSGGRGGIGTHKPETAQQNERLKILWDFEIQMDNQF